MNARNRNYVIYLHGTVSVILLVGWVWTATELIRTKTTLHHVNADIRLTRDALFTIDAQRRHTLNGDVPQAIQYLRQYDIPFDPDELGNKYLAGILSDERQRAVNDIIAFLRTRTGQDFGDDPERWVEELSVVTPQPEGN